MKKITIALIFIFTIPFTSCKESTTETIEDNNPKLVLSADKVTGNSNLSVNFTGNFTGNIDTIKMLVPSSIMFPGTGKTVIIYNLPDSTVPAKKIYNSTFNYTTGTFKAVMMVQSKYKRYYSDTLLITVK